jgi:hypothetical protein
MRARFLPTLTLTASAVAAGDPKPMTFADPWRNWVLKGQNSRHCAERSWPGSPAT